MSNHIAAGLFCDRTRGNIPEDQSGPNRRAAGSVGVSNNGFGGIAGRIQTVNDTAVLARDLRLRINHQAARRSNVTGVDLRGVERAFLHCAERRVRLMVAVTVETIVFVFAAVEILVDACARKIVEPLEGEAQLLDRHVDLLRQLVHAVCLYHRP